MRWVLTKNSGILRTSNLGFFGRETTNPRVWALTSRKILSHPCFWLINLGRYYNLFGEKNRQSREFQLRRFDGQSEKFCPISRCPRKPRKTEHGQIDVLDYWNLLFFLNYFSWFKKCQKFQGEWEIFEIEFRVSPNSCNFPSSQFL